ncbi:kelch-like protein 2 [Crassostrea angulata]|uniref:kelch-like protein 2 n=1 Tax=Magallana angulata TaxID=2784310 RepID=UPI0022B0E543|nr:kelch-like protein 2 [Crassostrea angulata]
MKDTMVVTTEVLPKREPIVVNRDVWYSYMSKEDADPQACWLERKRQERIKAEKAAMGASTSRVSTSTTSSSGSVILESLKLRYIQQKVDRNQNQTPSPPSSVSLPSPVSSTASDYEVPRNPKKSSPKAENESDIAPLSGHIQSSNRKHYANIGQYLNEIYNREQICDISFKLGSIIYPVHKVVLASQSPLFEKMFDSKDFTQPPIRPRQIRVTGVSEGSLKTFLNCIYSGDINIIKPNCLHEVIDLSRMFEVQQITQMCLQKISSLGHHDMLKLLQKMRRRKDVQLCDILMDAIAKNFMEIRNSSSFCGLDVDTVCMILSNDRLNVSSEMDIFESAVSWLHHPEDRLKNLERVMDIVRFSHLSSQQLMECFVKCPALKQSPYCVGLITMANWVQTSISLNQQDPLNLEIQEPRSLANSGGSVEQYLKTHCSSEFKEPDVTYDIVLMTEDAVEDFNRHACSRSQSRSTISAPCVKQYRESKWSMMNDNEKVLAWLRDHNHPKLDEYSGLQSMDCMMGRKPKQKHAPKMEGKSKDKHVKKKRSERDQKQDIADDCHKAIDISDDYRKAMVWGGDQWYMVGGARYKDSECPSPTNKVLVYSYETKEWRPVAPLNVARMEHSLCEVDGYIFAIGGIGEGNRLLSSVECYNPRTNCWFFVKALPEPRAAASTSAEGGNVCLKGGYSAIKNGQPSSSYYENEVELFYNMEINKWIRRS